MSAIYQCCDPMRRQAVAASAAVLSGIDYIEVHQGATVADPTTIDIVLVKPLPLPTATLIPAEIEITGGVRFAAPKAALVEAFPGPNQVARYRVTLAGNQPTDYSTYRLAIVNGPGGQPPPFIDPRLAAVDFSFKIDCPSDFDCQDDCGEQPAASGTEPLLDYAARDWRGFRRQMLDRVAAQIAGFREDDAADFTVTLIEALAYRADQQSYRLDSIGTEAFLDTARAPSSLARLARMVDYRPGQGASARVPLAFTYKPGGMADGLPLAASTPVLARNPDLPPVLAPPAYARALSRSLSGVPDIFETLSPLTCWSWRNRLAFHTWSDSECRLPKGATSCTFVDDSGGNGPLTAGDLLILMETRSPETGSKADADPEKRWLVRLVAVEHGQDALDNTDVVTATWGPEDALPFDLVLSARQTDQSQATPALVCAEACGNVVIADHGASTPPPPHLGLTSAETEALRPRLDPPAPKPGFTWRPKLTRADVARTSTPTLAGPPWVSAQALLDPGEVLPALSLTDAFSTWHARTDLLASGRFDRDFVVETGLGGQTQLRFGDRINGLAPADGTVFLPAARFGVGRPGLVGHDVLTHVAVPASQAGAAIEVTNPLPGRGGADAEPAASIRLKAPEAWRTQDRAVTAEDYARCALRHPAVINALAIPRWTGAWQTILLYVDRQGGLPVDGGFIKELMTFLERFRLMGFDIAVRGARPAPLDIKLRICAEPEALRAVVGQRVREALRPFGPRDGAPGFFHPDRFSFGTPLYLSNLVAAAMAVAGVETVTPITFQRYGKTAQGELDAGIIRPAEAEIIECADDPSFPERGRLALVMGGGR
ncbi:putative baseplate assembly protein [Rhizobium sp. WYCCWR 11128]|uniref:putative baseplate assembly protein n=1 Tax=Rhizobium sp. WYCCWR 11128 TaxID=2749832 RepID=UPI0015D2E712|nr:putative baseplate assembly protein [Rhizobium sp. WYCCWR 11128]NYT32052.1 putative baseplate assembly protein [Rhizobium sp. WYCCWR 11128]